MAPGITILLLLIGWIAIALWVGRFVYRHAEKRWVQIVTVLVVLWLPLWDVIPGLYFYYKAVRQISGVHVHRQVTAQGYLDRSRTNDSFAWSLLKTLPYQYMEVEITRRFNLRQSSSGGPTGVLPI